MTTDTIAKDTAQVNTLRVARTDETAKVADRLISEAKDNNLAEEVAKELYESKVDFDSAGELVRMLRKACANKGYKPTSGTRAYYTLTNVLRSVAVHYAANITRKKDGTPKDKWCQGWSGAPVDSAWDYDGSAEKVVKKHKDDLASLTKYAVKLESLIAQTAGEKSFAAVKKQHITA